MRRPSWLPLLVPVAATVLVTGILKAVDAYAAGPSPLAGAAMFLVLPLPLALSAVWGWAAVRFQPFGVILYSAAAAVGLALLLDPGAVFWQVAASGAAGLVAGLALKQGWRADKALGLCALALLPVIVWTVKEVPVAEQLSLLRQDMVEVLEQRMPQGATETERARALDSEGRRLDQILEVAARIYPLVIAIGLLGQAAIILAAIWVLVRLSGPGIVGRRFGSFSRCRLPFYLVWLLVAGMGMLLTRREALMGPGLNLALLAGLVLSVQGVAVQVFVIGRMLSPMGRLMFWMVMGVFCAPLVIVSGTVLGLADQWLDFRGLDRPDSDVDEKVV